VLTSAGLVEGRRHGQQVIYSLTTSVLADIVTELADMGRLNESPKKATIRGRGAHSKLGGVGA